LNLNLTEQALEKEILAEGFDKNSEKKEFIGTICS